MRKKIDQRTLRTKHRILTTFEEMICEKKPELINIKALTDRCGIHRKTFYLHYTCIEALYEDALNILIQQYNDKIAKLPNPYTYYDLTKILFEFYSKNEYRECLFCNPKYVEFSSRLGATTLKHNRSIYNPYQNYSIEMQNIINAFVSQASAVAFRQWVADGKKVPMDDAIQMVGSLLEKGVQSIIK